MRSVVDQDVCVAQDEAHAQYRGIQTEVNRLYQWCCSLSKPTETKGASRPRRGGPARRSGCEALGLQLQLRIVLGSSKRGTEDKALAALHWQRGEVRGASSDVGLS